MAWLRQPAAELNSGVAKRAERRRLNPTVRRAVVYTAAAFTLAGAVDGLLTGMRLLQGLQQERLDHAKATLFAEAWLACEPMRWPPAETADPSPQLDPTPDDETP